MKIKTKLTLGVGLLVAMIILLSAIGVYEIRNLAIATENILVANYNTMDYSRNMMDALDVLSTKNEAIEKFEKNLRDQENNVTEPGEGEMTDSLRSHFEQLKENSADSSLRVAIRSDLSNIMKVNLDAIQRKSKLASETADKAILWIPAVGALCFMLAFILLLNLPGNIANPIQELTQSIKQIASRKYSERVHFEGHNEYGELAKSFNVMAQKLEEYNNSNLSSLMMEKKRIETLINNMHDPVIGLDENRKIIFVNDEALQILGLKPDDVMGKPAQDISMQNDLLRLLLKDVGTGISSTGVKIPVKIYAHGKESYFEKEIIHIRIKPTGEAEKIDIGDVIILRNVTSYKELDAAKTNFMATLSHEFKTPIAAIQMSVDLLRKQELGPINTEQKELLVSIEDDASRLLKITAEILNLSQVETGNIQMATSATDPKIIFQRAIQINKIQADQKNIQLVTDYPDDLPLVQADEEKTMWVLSNLISNAIRYSYDQSTIYLSIRNVRKEVRFSVRDTGQGISPQYKDKVFDRYFRIPGTKKEGTGLGLSISKELIEAQGGHIEVESDYGAGSTFSFSLPLAPNPEWV